MGSDVPAMTGFTPWMVISIHAPRMGSDFMSAPALRMVDTFQSTLPGWGATDRTVYDLSTIQFQSTLPGWGATAQGLETGFQGKVFQSTLPGWGATGDGAAMAYRADISIHAPRMGSDSPRSLLSSPSSLFQSTLPGWGATRARPAAGAGGHFNPRSPDGERHGEAVVVGGGH